MVVQEPKLKIQNLLIGAGVILLVIAGFFYFKSQKSQEPVSSPSPEEIIVQEEGTVKKTGEVVQPMSEEEIRKMKEEVDGVLLTGGQAADLKDVSGEMAHGEAKRAFSDGKFYYKVEASGLKPVEKGYYYEGWLKKDDEYLSTGRIEVDAVGKGVLYYTASVDRSEWLEVVVTLEPEDGNPAPATHILEGRF